MKGLLFLNGTPPSDHLIKTRCLDAIIYCTDGAYNYLNKFLEPNVLIGDFDSIQRDTLAPSKNMEIIEFAPEKNFTDGFLAIKTMIERGIDDIEIYGAFGGRPDQEMSNYFLLALALKLNSKAKLVGETYHVYLSNGNFIANTQKGKTVSLVPFTDEVHILYTKGLKYPIHNQIFNKYECIEKDDYIMGVSNKAESCTIEYAIKSGLALVYLEK